jgi:hypothetical protein
MNIRTPRLGDARLRSLAGICQALIVGATTIAIALLLNVAADSLADPSATPPASSNNPPAASMQSADFGNEKPSANALHLANWIADSGDHENSDFVIVDKQYAKAYVFDAHVRLRGASPVLLGSAIGDDSVPDIGLRPIAEVRPEERTTPAGRFVAEPGRNLSGEDVVWVDYDAAVSMHRVRATKPSERRLQRLATPSIDDNRISYGCINVPVAFYETYIRPIFATKPAIVYVLPDTKPVREVFGSYDVKPPRHAANRFANELGKAAFHTR